MLEVYMLENCRAMSARLSRKKRHTQDYYRYCTYVTESFSYIQQLGENFKCIFGGCDERWKGCQSQTSDKYRPNHEKPIKLNVTTVG